MEDISIEEPKKPEQEMITMSELPPVWVKRAIIVEIISIVISFATAVIGFWLSSSDYAVTVMSFGFQSVLDIGTSSIVLWRLRDTTVTSIDNTQFISRREKQSSILISFLLIIFGTIIGVQAIYNLSKSYVPDPSIATILTTLFALLIWLVLGALKMKFSMVLNSMAIRKDAWIFFVSTLLATGICIGGAIYRRHNRGRWINSTVALLVSLWMLIYGAGTSVSNLSVWKTRDFWA